MKCKKCEKDIICDDYKKVADWFFCLECFDDLMQQSEKKAESEAKPESDNRQIPVSDKKAIQPEKNNCSVCGAEIEKETGKRLGTWRFFESRWIF